MFDLSDHLWKLESVILVPSVLNGLANGAVYALVALGLTLIYGVLHIINFAHGALLMIGMFAAYFLFVATGIDPYLLLPVMIAAGFAFGFGLQRGVIGPTAGGRDENILLVTLGLSIVLENAALLFFSANTRTIDLSYGDMMVVLGPARIALPKVIAFGVAILLAAGLYAFIRLAPLGQAIRAVAKEKQGAQLVGIDVPRVYAYAYGIGTACLGAAAVLLLPSFYVDPYVGYGFVLISFTIVVLGGMGSFPGALIGGLIIGVTESVCGLFLGESLGQIGIFLIFVTILLFRPTGLFGART